MKESEPRFNLIWHSKVPILREEGLMRKQYDGDFGNDVLQDDVLKDGEYQL